jgi:hypothetical protein
MSAAFERGTATFNAHDIDGFTKILADDVVFKAPGRMHGEDRLLQFEWDRSLM